MKFFDEEHEDYPDRIKALEDRLITELHKHKNQGVLVKALMKAVLNPKMLLTATWAKHL